MKVSIAEQGGGTDQGAGLGFVMAPLCTVLHCPPAALGGLRAEQQDSRRETVLRVCMAGVAVAGMRGLKGLGSLRGI